MYMLLSYKLILLDIFGYLSIIIIKIEFSFEIPCSIAYTCMHGLMQFNHVHICLVLYLFCFRLPWLPMAAVSASDRENT